MNTPTRLVLIGHPVAHSLSPRIQNAALAAANIPAAYSTLDVLPDDLDSALQALRRDGVAGNVTVPHKRAVLARCNRVAPAARAAGAVNTFWFDGDVLVGSNTDVGGFDHTVRDLMARHARPLPSQVTILGAGGSAAAVALAACEWPDAAVTIWARNRRAAEQLSQRFGCARAERDLAIAVARAELVVNATPIGLHDDLMPVALDLLAPGAAVVDLVYGRLGTAWVRAARDAGIVASDGLPMLVEQGALAFQCWFGVPPDRRVMWEAARAG